MAERTRGCRNKAGSTPLPLTAFTAGCGGSGSPHAREQQGAIVQLLLERARRVIDRASDG